MTFSFLFSLLLALPIRGLYAQANVTEMQGLLEKSVDSGVAYHRVAKVPAPVKELDRLRTGRESAATVTFANRSMIKMGASSSLILSKADREEASVLLGVGALHAWINKALSKHFTVRTLTATLAVRGTEFSVEFNERNETSVDVPHGVVWVKTALGEEVELGDGRTLRSLRILPDRPLDLPQPAKEPSKQGAEEFKHDLRSEVALGLSKDAAQAAAAVEARRAEYMEGKTMVDVFGKRVRLEEYVLRPQPDEFKLVVLNERSDSLNFFYYQAQFNQTLPPVLSSALQFLNGKTGAAPDFFITNFETGRSNGQDTILENGTGGHLVNAPLGADTVAYDEVSNSFATIKAGTPFWSTLFNNYSYKVDGTEKYGWQPAVGVVNITAYDYVATGFNRASWAAGRCAARRAVPRQGRSPARPWPARTRRGRARSPIPTAPPTSINR